MIDHYPYAMLNEKYARLAPPKTLGDRIASPIEAGNTLWKAMVHKNGHDPQLADLEDNLKRGGSLLIATLATLGLSNRILGIGEFLGFVSWYAAMAITPKIVNALVWLKTGVNLNEEYINTRGIREPLFKDRKYLPLHLIPDERIDFIADRLGIPGGIPDRRRLTEEKIAQVSVQGRTWWMLVAGPATVAVSGFLCNLLEDKIAGLLNSVKKTWALRVGLYQTLQKQGPIKAEELIPKLDSYLEQKIGKIQNSELSRWWRHFGEKMPKVLGLQRSLSLNDVINPISQPSMIDQIIKHLEKIGQDPDYAHHMEVAQEFMKESREYIEGLDKELQTELRSLAEHLGTTYTEQYSNQIRNRILNASVTLSHYDNLLKAVKKRASAQELRDWLEKPVLSEVQKLLDQGEITEARKYVGYESLFQEVRSLIQSGSFQTAFEHMGASPANHLIQSLKSTMLGKLWKKRIIWGLGGTLFLSTAFFAKFILGRNFGRQANGLPPNFKRDWHDEGFKKWS